MLTAWLRTAIREGLVSEDPAGSGFPRYVWVQHEGVWFEARLVNSEQGSYKGYPLADDEVPHELQRRGRNHDD